MTESPECCARAGDLPDGSTVPVRYSGRGEEELFGLLKLFLGQ